MITKTILFTPGQIFGGTEILYKIGEEIYGDPSSDGVSGFDAFFDKAKDVQDDDVAKHMLFLNLGMKYCFDTSTLNKIYSGPELLAPLADPDLLHLLYHEVGQKRLDYLYDRFNVYQIEASRRLWLSRRNNRRYSTLLIRYGDRDWRLGYRHILYGGGVIETIHTLVVGHVRNECID